MGIRLVWTILYNYLQRTTNYANCTKTEGTENAYGDESLVQHGSYSSAMPVVTASYPFHNCH